MRSDLDDDSLEAVWVDILLPKSKPILVGVCYRPPEQRDFDSRLEEVFNRSDDFVTGEVCLLGDMNTDVSDKDHFMFKALLNLCSNFNLTQIIQVATRITESSSTTIDLVLVTDKSKISNSGAIDFGLSDHSLIFCTCKVQKSALGYHNSARIRSVKTYSGAELNQKLLNMDWTPGFRCVSVNNAWRIFKTMFLTVVNEIAPLMTVRLKVRSEPWVNEEILRTIKQRNDTLSEFRKSKDEQVFKTFKTLRNEVNRLIKKAKAEFFNEKISEHRSKPRQLWKCLKQTGYSSRLKTKVKNIKLDIGGSLITENVSVANSLNHFFVTIANKLVQKLPRQTDSYGEKHVQNFYRGKGVQADAFVFSAVSEDTVFKKFKAMQPAKAMGQDEIPVRFLQDVAEAIMPCLTFIINLSLEQRHVPDDFKLARVIPLHKKGSKLDPGNYCPVSILNSVSKVMEKIIFDQINEYLAQNNLLYKFQSGFRPSHSTDTCLLYLTDLIRTEIDDGKYCGMVLLDLQKAFDTVNFSILLFKLKALGFNSASIQRVRSYLEGRRQVVEVSGTISSPLQSTCGVPQGNILGPLLFLIYVNDMKAACDNNLFLFADDAAILVSHRDKREVEKSLSQEPFWFKYQISEIPSLQSNVG